MRRLVLLAAACCVLVAPLARAAAPQWGGSVTASSTYLDRGVSRSNNDPALSAELHAQSAQGWFASAWVSSSRVRASDPTSVDVAATLGLGGLFTGTDWAWRGSYTHYESPWQYPSGYYRYDEFTLDLRWRETLLLSASYSPDVSAYAQATGPVWHRDAWTYEATFQHAWRADLRGHAGAGYYDLDEHFGEGYWYGSAGLAWNRRHWQADLSYVHPGAAARRLSYVNTAHRRAVLQVSYVF